MAITLRGTKGSALTHAEMDANFQTITDNSDGSTAITPDINGGTIDGAAIGGASPSTGSFTSLRTSGNLGVGGSPSVGENVRVMTEITGSTTANSIYNTGIIQSDVTTIARYFATFARTEAASFTLTDLYHFNASQGTIGAGSTVTNQYGYRCGNSLVGATNNYGFYGNIPSGSGRFNFYAAGAAPNSFSGDVTIHGAGKLGYTTGSGGAVTQLTSRTTGVELNKTNGAITIISAAGSTSWQTFTVTNSTVAATDTVHICQKSGTDLNMVHITAVAAGSFNVTFATTGGTTTEQPVFNFAVIKGVAS